MVMDHHDRDCGGDGIGRRRVFLLGSVVVYGYPTRRSCGRLCTGLFEQVPGDEFVDWAELCDCIGYGELQKGCTERDTERDPARAQEYAGGQNPNVFGVGTKYIVGTMDGRDTRTESGV